MELSGLQSYSINKEKVVEKFVVLNNENATLFLDHFSRDVDIEIDLKSEAKLLLGITSDDAIENGKILVNLEKEAEFEVYFADFSVNLNKLDVLINLNGNGAKAVWHLASLADNKDNKNINVSIMHIAPETFGKVDNYGVCKNDAKLLFAGISHILNGSVKSKTQQNAKIMVFDEHSDAIAKPILKIDENDIEANHAAAVGKINDEHLFYLTSRGISVDEARLLITLGYLKPIFKGFDEKRVEYLNKLIGGRLWCTILKK